MGHIVRLRFGCLDTKRVKLLVCSLPHFCEYDPQTREFYFRGKENKAKREEMPDAFIRIQDDGLEFCAFVSNSATSELYEQLKRRISIELGPYSEEL